MEDNSAHKKTTNTSSNNQAHKRLSPFQMKMGFNPIRN